MQTSRDSTIKQLRLSIGITQNELAIQAGVSRHSVIRQEQLCYPTPLPSIISLLSDVLGTSEDLIIHSYLRDVSLNRHNTGLTALSDHDRLIYLANKVSRTPSISIHPFQIWRESVFDRQDISTSRIHFSQLCSIHPATLSKYEAFKTGFPTPIEVAFKEMNLPSTLLDIFNSPAFNTIR